MRRRPSLVNVIDITNTDQNRTYSLTAEVNRPIMDRWSATAAYTYSRAEDVNSTTSSQAFSNWRFNPIVDDPNNPELRPSNFDVPHRFLLSALYQGDQRLQVTLDVINFGNLLNRNWGLVEFVPNQNDNTVFVVNNRNPDAAGRVLMNPVRENPSVLQVSNLGSRYQFQLGVRYAF